MLHNWNIMLIIDHTQCPTPRKFHRLYINFFCDDDIILDQPRCVKIIKPRFNFKMASYILAYYSTGVVLSLLFSGT